MPMLFVILNLSFRIQNRTHKRNKSSLPPSVGKLKQVPGLVSTDLPLIRFLWSVLQQATAQVFVITKS